MAHRIWPGTRALAQLHLDQGQRVWLVTAAPIEIATIIARRLGLTGALGTVAEHVDGVYTGAARRRHPARARPRAVAVQELADRFGLDLDRCSAYSDSYNDLPLLNAVGDPCAINPDAACATTPAPTAGGSATTGPAARPPGPVCSPPPSPAAWPARSRPGRRSGAGSAEPRSTLRTASGRIRPGWHGSPSGSQRPYRRVASQIGGQPTAQSVGTDTWLDTICSVVSTRCVVPSSEFLEPPVPAVHGAARASCPTHRDTPWLLTQTSEQRRADAAPAPRTGAHDDSALATSSLRGRGRGHPADRAGRAGPQRRLRGLRTALRPLPRERLPVPLLPGRLGAAGRGPHRRDLLPGAALDELVPLAGQGLRRLADDHRAQPDHRPLQGRSHPPGVRPPRT